MMNEIDMGLTSFWNEDTPYILHSEMYCVIPASALFLSDHNKVQIRQKTIDPLLRIRFIGSSLPSFVKPQGGIYDGFSWQNNYPNPATGKYVNGTPIIFLESIPEVY